jgi:phosphoglycerate kinase
MKKRLQDMDVNDKTIIVRFDYNVPMYNGVIVDDTKIRQSVETINYLLERNCKIVILSHLGKIKKEEDKLYNSLAPIALRLKEILNKEITFYKDILDPELPEKIKQMPEKEIIMLENTRFLDVPNKLESNCDIQISSFLASLGDIFVMDAFASSHRAHASTVGIAKFIPSCMGLLVEKELEALDNLLNDPKHPFTVIMGGAKVEDKLELIEALLPKCEHLLLAGGLANSFLKTLNFNIGASLATDNDKILEKLKEILLNNREKIMLPLDAIVGSTYDDNYTRYKRINEITDNEIIYDIGIKTLEKYAKAINESETLFLNGTMGVYENKKYRNGTQELLSNLKKARALTIAGGGDAISAIKNLGFQEAFTYLSTGGGATLEYLAKGSLVAIDGLMEDEEIEVLDV